MTSGAFAHELWVINIAKYKTVVIFNLLELLAPGSCEAKLPNLLREVAGNAAAFVHDLDEDVVPAGANLHHNWTVGKLWVGDSVLANGPGRIFQNFKTNILEMDRDVDDGRILWPLDNKLRRIAVGLGAQLLGLTDTIA